jgi:PiT family inorganic phosphate transporter
VPSSSTHALVGGLIGALYGIAGDFKYVILGDWGYMIHATGVVKVLITLFMSPLIGFFAGWFCLKLLILLLSGDTARMHKVLRRLQLIVVPILAFGHGANDTQKGMGLLVLALACSPDSSYATTCFTAGSITSIPLWVRLLVGFAMVSGVVAMAPGIVKRVGSGIYKQRGLHSFVSELASAKVGGDGSATG